MKVCMTCRKKLVCIKTGVGLDFGNGTVYAADIFECPQCKTKFANANSAPYYDPEYGWPREYAAMVPGGKETWKRA